MVMASTWIVGDVNHCGLEALVELDDLRAHLGAHPGVEVRSGSSKRNTLGWRTMARPKADALALADRRARRLAAESIDSMPRMRGGLGDAPLDFALRELPKFQAESHAVENAHVRVEGVLVEDHRDVAVLGREVVDALVADDGCRPWRSPRGRRSCATPGIRRNPTVRQRPRIRGR